MPPRGNNQSSFITAAAQDPAAEANGPLQRVKWPATTRSRPNDPAVPLAGLAALSWLRPGWAVYVLAALTAAVTGVSIWFALNPQAWRSFEDRHGPVRAVITFVLVAAIAVLGLKRTVAAGILLLAAGVIPVAVSSLGSFLGFASLSIVSAAPVITGILYLISAQLAGRRSAPPASTGTGATERPKAA